MFTSWLHNFRSGLRLMLGRPVARQHFTTSLSFMLVALALSLALFAGLDYAQLEHVRFQDIRGTALLGTFLGIGLLLALVAAHLESDYPQLPVLLCVLLACLPFSAILLSVFPFDWIMASQSGWLLAALLAFFAFVVVRSLRVAFYRPRTLTQVVAVVGLVLVASFSWQRFYFPTVFDSYDPLEYAEEPAVDAEHTFYQQQRLVDRQLALVSPSEPNSTDYFFLGFGGSDRQTVFESETLYAKELFDELYDTGSRSVVLFNNVDKLEEQPLANTYNLARSIAGLGARMDSEEDVLILLLTSHGDDDATLAVELESLELKVLSADWLRDALDSAQIKWRIIIISACYSGSFIDALEDENTLIVTAASAERNSFGCSSDRELTVFGEAYLKRALGADSNWITAFDQARELIATWESEAELTQSQPQIRLGHNLRLKLGLPLPPAPVAAPDSAQE